MKISRYPLPDGSQPIMHFRQFVHELFYGGDSATVILEIEKDTPPFLRIVFDSFLTYRYLDESKPSQRDSLSIAPDIYPWPLITMESSEFLDWFHQVSCGIHEADSLLHYEVFTPNAVLEIIAFAPPIIDFVDEL